MTFSKSNLPRVLSLALRVVLGAVFVYAAYLKLREPWQLFAFAIDGYEILPAWAVNPLARTLPWFEAVLGVLLIAGLWLRFSSTAMSLILSGFFVLMVRAFVKGMEISCGCFGPSGDPISWRTVLRDGILLALSLTLTGLTWASRRSPKPIEQPSEVAPA